MTYTQNRDNAETDYVNTLRDQAFTQINQAPELGDTLAHNTEALNQVNEQADMSRQLANASNQGYTQERVIEQQNAERQVQQQKLKDYQKAWQDNRNKQIAKNTAINEYKQFATEQAKRKYELASQRLQQAQSNIGNINKIFQGLGVTLSMIPGWGWIAGAAVSGASAIGTSIASRSI